MIRLDLYLLIDYLILSQYLGGLTDGKQPQLGQSYYYVCCAGDGQVLEL